VPVESTAASAAPVPDAHGEASGNRAFARRLAVIVAIGVLIRVLYTVLFAPWPPKGLDDQGYYHLEPLLIAHGRGFIEPVYASIGRVLPTAEHPPLYPIVLAGLAELGGTGDLVQRLAGSVFGAGTIMLVGLLGRRLAGPRAGIVAAALAALYPILITADGALMSETLDGLIVAGALVAAFRLYDAPTLRRGLGFGALVGLAALTRGESVLLFPLAMAALARRPGTLRPALAALVALAVVLTPWTVRNVSVFGRFVAISNDTGGVIGGANCDATYSGSFLGSWSFLCNHGSPGNEAVQAARDESAGLHYALHHLRRLPAVMAARFERLWGLRQPMQVNSGRAPWAQNAGVIVYYILLGPAMAGLVVLRRRRRELWILVTPAIMVTIAALLGYGFLRLREPAELTLVVLAGVGLDAFAARRQSRTRSAFHSAPSPQAG
jgi:4-amino-4-deoxy-L-arabinose transferase-like glycosyltransferase